MSLWYPWNLTIPAQDEIVTVRRLSESERVAALAACCWEWSRGDGHEFVAIMEDAEVDYLDMPDGSWYRVFSPVRVSDWRRVR